MDEVNVAFGPCCFCGDDIKPSNIDPCSVTVETSAGLWQVWHCHGDCFKARLTSLPDAPDFFEPAHF